MWLLSNWKAILAGIVVFAFVVLAWINNERGHAIESMKQTISQLAANQEQCAKDKKLTEDAANDLQKQLYDLDGQLAVIKLREPAHCITVYAPDTSGQHDAATTGQKPPASHAGINSNALYDFAATDEKLRLQLINCQSFVRDVWRSRGNQ